MEQGSDQGNVLLGIDLSTTGAKAVLVDEQRKVLAIANTPLTLAMPQPRWAEQAPEDWWQATCTSLRDVLAAVPDAAARLCAIGLTGQMHGLVLLDEAGSVLRPAILWNDQRTAAECETIRTRVGRERLLHLTGNDALPGFTAPKLLWVREHESEVYARIRHVLLPKDYIRYRLTEALATDVADASGTLLLDLRQRAWSDPMLSALEIPREWLPELHEGTGVTGAVTPRVAEATGLRAGTPVVAGGGDQAAQAVGVGAVTPGVLAITVGTSGVIFAPTEQPLVEAEGRLHAFCHAVPGMWHLMGVMLSAAFSLQWYRERFAPELTYDALLHEAAGAPAGSDGLLFLPYLMGERTPYADPLARGAFVGLTYRHGRSHLTRAVLEGVAFGLRDCLELLRATGLPTPGSVRLSGGGARGIVWRQILASVLGLGMVTVPMATEGAAYGAALLAGVGVGLWPDVAAATAGLALSTLDAPTPRDVDAYEAAYARYRDLYPALSPIFARL